MAAKKKAPAKKKASTRKKAPPNPSKKLRNRKHEHFCQVYIIHYNGAAAWRTADGREKNQRRPGDYSQAYDVLRLPEIIARIEYLEGERQKRIQIDQDKILLMLSSMANADVTQAIDDDGNLLPLDEIPADVRLMIEGFEMIETQERNEEGELEGIGRLKKIKMAKRLDAIKLAGNHVAVQAFKEQKEVTTKTLEDLLDDDEPEE